LRIGHLELRQKSNAPRHALIFRRALAAEENRAGIARANKFVSTRIDQMLMVTGQLGAAQFAGFNGTPLSGELTQCGKRVVFLRAG
jgi:hypothetical protein